MRIDMNDNIATKAEFDYDAAMRRTICQYCLDQNRGIQDKSRTNAAIGYIFGPAITTSEEAEKAKAELRPPRYVYSELIDAYMRHPRIDQLREAIARNYNIDDFERWQLIQDLIGARLSSVTAKEISDILIEKESLDVRDLGPEYYRGIDGLLLFIGKLHGPAFRPISDLLKSAGIDIKACTAERRRQREDMPIIRELPGYPAKEGDPG